MGGKEMKKLKMKTDNLVATGFMVNGVECIIAAKSTEDLSKVLDSPSFEGDFDPAKFKNVSIRKPLTERTA